MGIVSLINYSQIGFGGFMFFIIGIAIILLSGNKTPYPQMKSAVRVMLNGMNRDFEFNKNKDDAKEVAEFVALIEETLTAYNKN